MAVTLLELEQALVDDALGMHDRIIARVLRPGKQRQAEALQSDAKQIKRALGLRCPQIRLLKKPLLGSVPPGWEPAPPVTAGSRWRGSLGPPAFQPARRRRGSMSRRRRLARTVCTRPTVSRPSHGRFPGSSATDRSPGASSRTREAG